MNGIVTKLKNNISLLVVTMLGLPLITPLLQQGSVPCTHDGHLHYHRVAAMYQAWTRGLYFTRWLPDLAFGYGYPFFIYREPAPLYFSLWLHLLGIPLPATFNIFYILCILLAGIFMYLWVRDIFGNTAGIVSAVAYMTAPYQLVDALIRGNQPESIAFTLFPFLCWAGRRFMKQGNAGMFLATTFGLALLALSHNISLLIFTPTLLVYLVLVGWLAKLDWKTMGWRLLLVFGFGLGMTIFYAGTALLELDSVTLSNSVTTRNNDFHFNFVTLSEMVAPVMGENPLLLNPPLLFRLGWIPLLLAGLGLISLARITDREQRGHILMMGVATVIFLFMALPLSLPLWENLPLIDFVQFPWRFVGRAALPLAILAGVPFALPFFQARAVQVNPTPALSEKDLFAPPEQRNNQVEMDDPPLVKMKVPLVAQLLPALAIILLTVETLPNLYPSICQEEPFPTIQTVHNYERETGLVGVDPEGSYFPNSVQVRPTDTPFADAYATGAMPVRFDASQLPASATLLQQSYTPNQATIQLNTPEAFTAYYLTFAFAGWQVTIDGEDVPITPSDPEGLITFPVPAGEHTIEVQWGSIPARTVLIVISVLAIAGTLFTAYFLRKPTNEEAMIPPSSPAIWLVTALLLVGLKVGLVDRMETPWRQANPLTPDTPLSLTAAELQLTGFNAPLTVASGQSFDIDLAWQTLSNPTHSYQSNIWLADHAGILWSDKETHRPRSYEDAPPVIFWQAGQWAWDSREVDVLTGTPPGIYDMVLTVFDRDTLQPVTLLNEDGHPVGPTAILGKIEVVRPAQSEPFTPQVILHDNQLGANLIGFDQDRTQARPGDPLLLTLYWQHNSPNLPAASLPLQLLDETGTVRQTWMIVPVHDQYPPSNWVRGERLRGQQVLRLPPDLDSGTYTFDLAGIALGTLTITAPDRLLSRPPIAVPTSEIFGDRLHLLGYTLNHAPDSLSLQLVWQAQQEMRTSYRVFVHVVDDAGNILAQADGEPVQWTRPTTGWTVDEFIGDSYNLSLDDRAQATTLRIGLYNADNGQRLLLEDAGSFYEIPLSMPQ